MVLHSLLLSSKSGWITASESGLLFKKGQILYALLALLLFLKWTFPLPSQARVCGFARAYRRLLYVHLHVHQGAGVSPGESVQEVLSFLSQNQVTVPLEKLIELCL
jgi:hypothetical protein